MDETSVNAKASNIFRILVVDDDPAGSRLLLEVMKNLQRRHEMHFVWDGVEALEFLHGRGAYVDAPRPHLILLDVSMPRLDGFETLSAIKTNPEFCTIPVIMLSTSAAPQDVRKSYEAHANCYVQKPPDLQRSMKFVQAVEAFWMDLVLFPPQDEHKPAKRQIADSKPESSQSEDPKPGESHTGPAIASEQAEVSSRAMLSNDSPAGTATPSRKSGCEEHDRLLDNFGMAVRELIDFHEQQFLAIVDGDGECHRFDLLIHMANEKKQLAKYAYLRHVEEHGCSNFDAVNNART
jgi:chemotaxis family two-component system response regulator Rcp1